MKLHRIRPEEGFTLSEVLVTTAIASILFAAIFAATVTLNRSYAASDDYFSTHMQQIRIMDYLARDVKRSFSVTTSPDLTTVTCIIPNYTVRAGDPEAVTDASTIGRRRTPVVVGPMHKAFVDYGTRNTRSVADGKTTNGSATITSATAAFTSSDVGNPISGGNIPAGTTILSRTNATTVVLSKNATATGTGKLFTIYGDGDRTVMDAATTSGSKVLTSTTAYFTAADVGKPIVGTSIPAGAKIASVTNSSNAVMSANALATAASASVTIGGTVVVYAINGNEITRTENGVLTTIASSTDRLLPETTDWQLSNTEYTTTTVTFDPIFVMGAKGKDARRAVTTTYATAYLRNKRRGN